MNWKKIFTIVALTGFSASVATGQGTAPTIVQGDYISNVFGQSNFIKNPNAKLNTKDVTVSNATVTRSTTTPLVATSEFLITTSTATGYADWATRTFDAGMKNQNCEARFTYRGFSVGSTSVQIRQGSNTVAQLTLTASTDPRIASINFPCGDLSSATTLRVQQATAALTGTNELSGLYLGLATNQANVAQAEMVVHAKSNTAQTINNGTTITLILGSEVYDPQDYYNSTTGVFTAKKPGNYVFSTRIVPQTSEADAQWYLSLYKNGSVVSSNAENVTSPYTPGGNTSVTYPAISPLTQQIELNTGDTVEIKFSLAGGANTQLLSGYSNMVVTRFPTSSELVVTPERQNVYGGVVYTNSNQTMFTGAAANNSYTTYNGTQWDDGSLKGKAALTTTGSGQDLGFSIPNLPTGNYKVEVSGLINAGLGNALAQDTWVRCNFRIYETTTATEVARQSNQDVSVTGSSLDETRDYTNAFAGVFTNSSVATRNFVLQANKFVDSTASSNAGCQAYSNTGANTYNTNITFLLTPLDQPSNSALYVQGPVKAAETGAAIPSGYVFNNFYGSQYSGSYVNNTWLSLVSTTLAPGLWQVEAACMMRNNTTSTTTGWNFAALSISDNNTDQGTDTNPHSYQYHQPSATGVGQYDFLNAKRVIYTTTTTLRYLNIYSSWTGGGTPTYNCQFFVMRLN